MDQTFTGIEATPRGQILRRQAERVIQQLRKRNLDGVYCPDRAAAVAEICRMIPAGALVGLGGSETIIESGLLEALRRMDIRLLDRYRPGIAREEVDLMRHQGLQSDVYVTGCNAITLDGQLVNQDGSGNRVAALMFGPKQVVVVAGMNKIVADVEAARRRIHTVAAPFNSVRVKVDTPCSRTGVCQDPHCHPPHRICCHLVVTEASMAAGRIRVVLVGETLGY